MACSLTSETGDERHSGYMALSVELKSEIISKHRVHAGDTGSPEVQIALLTGRIQDLTEHLKTNKKDHASRPGLLKMGGQRTNLLKYLTRSCRDRYQTIIAALGLRK